MPKEEPARHPRRHPAARAFGLLALSPFVYALAFAPAPPLLAIPLDRLVSPRPAHWVLDTTATLSPQEIGRIDAEAEGARRRTGGEIAVVVVDSTGGLSAREYATALANRWLVGDQGLRNGVLILLAKADRRSEIALGKGIDGERERRIARDLLEREMAPRFRAGDWAGGLLAGVRGAGGRILPGSGERPGRP